MIRRRALLLLPLAAACRRAAPTLRPLGPDSTVLCFGDSLTAGTGAEEKGESYPSRLAVLLGCRVVNAGKPGEESGEALPRLTAALETHRPQLVVLGLGGNDILRGAEDRVIRDNLLALVAACRKAGADVLLFASPKPGLVLRPAKLYREVAQRENIPLEEEAVADILSTPTRRADPIHPNEVGYRVLAERIHARIRAAGG